jgi:hypothetical protein
MKSASFTQIAKGGVTYRERCYVQYARLLKIFEVMISDFGKRWRVRIYKMRAIQRRGAAQLVMSIWDA